MYELIQVSEHDYYIDCPSKIGIVKISDSDVVLIDSGSDKSTGKIILKTLDTNGWKVKSVLLTHSHADHIGGNRVIQERTGCRIYASGIECAYSNFPVIEPALLYGSFPLEELRCKFLEAQSSNVLPLTDEILPSGFKVIKLDGHTTDMTGFLTPDGTFYIGDCLASEENLQKHPVTFITQVAPYISTLEKLIEFEAKCFVPSHAPACSDIKELAEHNISKVHEISELIRSMCEQPVSFENLLSKLMDYFTIPGNTVQYYLIGSTLKAYLNYLLETDKVSYHFEGTAMLWKSYL